MTSKDVLIFDIVGHLGHFRKYYTNSSSLSYSVPTRTSLIGMIAGVMGYERDSYYDLFSLDIVSIGLQKISKTRRIMQSLNYMKITSKKDFIEPKNHTQIPFELILGQDELLRYRVYISHGNMDFLDKLQRRIKGKKYHFPPFLGAAPFNCQLQFVDRTMAQAIKGEGEVMISTVIPINHIKHNGLVFKKINSDYMLLKEKMPRDFNKNRVVTSVGSYLFDENCSPIPINIDDTYYKTARGNILFM